jgi:hypothetical protein
MNRSSTKHRATVTRALCEGCSIYQVKLTHYWASRRKTEKE